MAVQQVNGGASYPSNVYNNKSSIRAAGTVAGTKFVSRPLGDKSSLETKQIHSNIPVIKKAVSAGNLAVMTPNKYVIMGVTTQLAGVTNNVLRSPGADFGERKSTNNAVVMRQTWLKTLSWTVNSSGVTVYTFTPVHSETIPSADNAVINDPYLLGGEFSYLSGKPNPVYADYVPKN